MPLKSLNTSGLFLLVILPFLTGCIKSPTQSKPLPFEINKRIVISEECNKIILAWNKNDVFRPVIVENAFSTESASLVEIEYKPDENLLPFSLSCDCRYLSLVADKSDGKYQVSYYDLKEKKILSLEQSEASDNGSSFFSPSEPILAYLSDGRLQLYNYKTKRYLGINEDAPASIKYITWMSSGKGIFLQDSYGDIYQYQIESGKYVALWQFQMPFYNNRQISSTKDDDIFYFISDHESGFNQIYKYKNGEEVSQVISSRYDKYLSGRPILDNELRYRENIQGNFVVKSNVIGLDQRYPSSEVIYDFYKGTNFDIYLSSSLNQPASIYKVDKNGKKVDLLHTKTVGQIQEPKLFVNSDGMVNYIYKPTTSNEKWLLWLHGGPHEQLSKRYNVFINTLVERGIGVIVLNYPGSTGIGNDYELRAFNSQDQQEIQLRAIKSNLKKLFLQYKIKELSVLGNSYGSVLAQILIRDSELPISRLIDFSGVYNGPLEGNKKPSMYLYGENDYVLSDYKRTNFLDKELSRRDVQMIVLPKDGHAINRRNNIQKVVNEIIRFLE